MQESQLGESQLSYTVDGVNNKDEMGADEPDQLENFAKSFEGFQPTGTTLQTSTVRMKQPFLLKHDLRE